MKKRSHRSPSASTKHSKTGKPRLIRAHAKENDFPTETMTSEEQAAGEIGGPISGEIPEEKQ
jgi:hypothetical protein